jgi:phage baseplate assembly protein W
VSAARYRSWRFFHPDVDAAGAFGGLRIAPTGGVEMAHGPAAVRQAVLLLLTTRPGERVMRPDYGCELHRLVFSPNDDTTAGLAIHYVRRALARWEPRVEVERIDAGRDEADPGRLVVRLDYRLRSTRELDRITFSLDLAGGPL